MVGLIGLAVSPFVWLTRAMTAEAPETKDGSGIAIDYIMNTVIPAIYQWVVLILILMYALGALICVAGAAQWFSGDDERTGKKTTIRGVMLLIVAAIMTLVF